MVGDKILSSKIISNTWLSVAIPSDFKKFILKKSSYGHLMGNLIVFAINFSNIIKAKIRYYYYIHFLSLSLICFFDFSGFTSRFLSF